MSWLSDIHQKTYERLVIPAVDSIEWTVSVLLPLLKARDYFKAVDEAKYEDCQERIDEVT